MYLLTGIIAFFGTPIAMFKNWRRTKRMEDKDYWLGILDTAFLLLSAFSIVWFLS